LVAASVPTVNAAVVPAGAEKHVGPAGACQARGDAPCRAAAGKLARQAKSTESRV
jgi:hypothetical protein